MKKSFQISFGLILVIIFSFFSCSEDMPTEPIVQDSELPTITIQAPTTESSYVTLDDELLISGTASDDQALSKIEWSTNSSNGTATGLENWSIQNMPLSDGDNFIIVTAFDKANNFAKDTIVITNNEYTNFYGIPFTNPTGVFKNQPTNVLIRANLSANAHLMQNDVKLLSLDDNNNIVNELCQLYDDGDLNHGDDIQGDNVFSTFCSFNESTIQEIKLRIAAKSFDGTNEFTDYSSVFSLNVFEEISTVEIQEIINTQQNAVNQLNNIISGSNLEQTLNQTITWLNSQPEVANANLIDGNIEIVYTSGIEGGMIISTEDASGVRTQGGVVQSNKREKKSKIPINKQTRGNYFSQVNKVTNSNIILDKDVFIYDPFRAVFDPYDKGDDVKDEFENSSMTFNIVHLKNQDCTIESLYNLTNYGYIYIDTHGSQGKWFLTGQIVNQNDDYDLLIREGKVKIYSNITYSDYLLFFTKEDDMYGVSNKFIQSLSGTFPNSIVFNSSCQSTSTNSLTNAFISKGCKTYLGVDQTAHSPFLKDVSVEFAHNMAVDENTSGEAFDNLSVTQDPRSPNANLELIGSRDMYYSNELINGDFEYGDLTAWSREGDGRVITQLGPQIPTGGNFMGIISTGLGFTTSTGTIFQSFKIEAGSSTLNLKWNFLSEEFLEWVGSQYQDYFKITIRNSSGQDNVIFNKAIDDFYNEYTLIQVSPQIVFDQGDVYMTGWQTFTYDLSQYVNQIIILIFSAGDVGDSIYDSAILLDDIVTQ